MIETQIEKAKEKQRKSKGKAKEKQRKSKGKAKEKQRKSYPLSVSTH